MNQSSEPFRACSDAQLQEFYHEAELSQQMATETILSIQDERVRRWRILYVLQIEPDWLAEDRHEP